jgi:hypothetical protein
MITIINFYTIKVFTNVKKKLILIKNIYNMNYQKPYSFMPICILQKNRSHTHTFSYTQKCL